MNAERWAQIDRLLDEALALPPQERAAFVTRATAGDEALRGEVASLLQAHDAQAAGAFLGKPAMEIAARQLAGQQARSLIGARLGTYQILSVLGVGGMGEVYLAQDERLKRRLALKVLPPHFVTDAGRVERFAREARAVSALNHPNIVTVYDIGEHEGTHFIAMEHVEGQTLREKALAAPRGKLDVKEVIEIALQAAAALSAAHEAGIIHRDIKPENLMQRRDGYLKVLDFGLVKLTEKHQGLADTLGDPAATNPGMVLGTVRYMSPEQALGQEVDGRSDIFSLGVVLYELLAGSPPFMGDTAAAILDAVVHHAPLPLTEVRPELAAEFARIVSRMLEKDRDLRYQTAGDVRATLKRMQKTLDSRATGELVPPPTTGPTPAVKSAPGRRAKALALGGVALLLLAAALAWWQFGGRDQGQAPDWRSARFTELTEYAGIKTHPALSPDGQTVVYARQINGQYDLIRQRVGGSTLLNLTEGSPANDLEPAFSPDGALLAFRSERNGGGIYVMGETGENLRLVVAGGYNPVWSPDGQEIAYGTQSGSNIFNRVAIGAQLWVINWRNNTKRQIAAGPDAVKPSWSPDGRRLAYWGLQNGAQRDLWTVAVDGGSPPVAVTSDKAQDGAPIWAPDGRHLYFASNRNGRLGLWRVALDQLTGRTLGEAEPLSAPSFYSMHLSFSADGKSLAYSSRLAQANLKRRPFDAARGEVTGPAVWVTQSTKRPTNQDISPDGQWLTYYVFGDAQFDLFVSKSDAPGEVRQLTNDEAMDRAPRWSHDGRRIAFFSNLTGKNEIWTINPDGSDRRQMTFSRADQPGFLDPAWSRDGTRMLFSYRGGGASFIMDLSRPFQEQELFTFPPPQELAEPERTFAAYSWSPDSRKIAGTLYTKDKEAPGIVLYDLATHRYERISPEGNGPAWLPDNRRLFYCLGERIYVLDSQTRAVRKLLLSPEENVDNPVVSRDGRFFYYTVNDSQESVWLISLK